MRKKFRANPNFISRKIAGESVLVAIGAMALKIHGMIVLSESGQLLWEKLQETCTESDLVEAILSEYDIDSDTAREDVSTFLDGMRQFGIVEQIEDEVSRCD